MSTKPKSLILPTASLLDDLYTELASMSIADYDMSELVSNAITSVTIVHEAKERIQQFASIYSQWGVRRGEAAHDGQILANAWVKFVTGIIEIYRNYNLWEANGVSYYYFDRMHYHDIIVSRFPDPLPDVLPG